MHTSVTESARQLIYRLTASTTATDAPRTATLSQSIHAMACGVVSSPGFDELVAVTYSGRVMSFTTEPVNVRDTSDAMGR